MAQSRNQLGEIGEDGILRDSLGNEVPVGLDEAAKAGLQALIDGPMVRHMPSERDTFVNAGGVLTAEKYKREDSEPSGHVLDLEADTGTKDETSTASAVANAEADASAEGDKKSTKK